MSLDELPRTFGSHGRTVAVALPLVLALAAASVAGPQSAQAASPESAPAACQTQVAAALRALAGAYAGRARRLSAGAVGTLEHAVAAYVPGRLHPVAEGALPPARAHATCPADMANVGGLFCVDRYEGSLVERLADGTTAPYPHYLTPQAGHVYVARSVAGVFPQGYVSAAQAQAACREAGKRLCQPVEWRVACAGSEGTAFPYGPTRIAGRCRDSGASPMLLFHAATMSRGWGPLELNDARNVQLDDTLAKTGAHLECVSDQGVYDMVGNLHEWTADPNGTFQGGYWLDTSQHGEGCAYRTISHGFEYHDYSTGFRCCADSK